MKLFSLLISTFSFLSLHAQPSFEKVYGGSNAESFQSVIRTSDGGFLAAGTTQSFGFGAATIPDFYAVKTDSLGDTLWTRAFGTASYEFGGKVLEVANHSYIIAGYGINPANNSYDFYVIKTDVDGNKIWDHYYGGASTEALYDAISINHNRIILCGSTSSFGSGGSDVYLVEIDSNGNQLSDQSIGNTGNESGNHIEETTDHQFIITGYTNSNTPGYDIYIIKTDSLFTVEWSRNYGSNGNDYGYSVIEDIEKNFFILGLWSTNQDSSNMVLIKTDSAGLNPVIKFPGTYTGDLGFSLNKTSDHGFIIGGYTQKPGKQSEMLLLKTDANGDTLWSSHFGGAKNEVVFDALQLNDGGFILAGETEGFGIDNVDGYLVRIDSNRAIPCPDSLSFIADKYQLCEDENVFFTNTTVSSQSFSWMKNGIAFSNSIDAAAYFNEARNYQITLEACNISASKNILVNAKPGTNFTLSISNDSVHFFLSPGIRVKSIAWNFGDSSNIDTLQINPVHHYSHSGSFWIILSVIDSNGCDSTFKKQIDVITGIASIVTEGAAFQISPDPAIDYANVVFGDAIQLPATLIVLNESGQVISKFYIHEKSSSFSLHSLRSGIYLIQCMDREGKYFLQKLFVE